MPAQAAYNYKVVLKAAGLYFAAVFGAGVVLGTLRALWLAPQIGNRAAELLEMPFMLAVMLVAALRIVRRLALPPLARYRLAMGGIALALLLATEFALVMPLRGMSLNEYLAALDPVSGSVYYAMLGLYALLPALLQSRRWYSSHRTALAVAALLAVFPGFAYMGYLADLEAARRRVASGSEIAYTPCGPIEYATTGEGPVVLLVHGAGGGFDQVAELGAGEQQRAARLMEHILPLSRRRAGLLNDVAIAQSLVPYPLEQISARTLVISLADDLHGTYQSAGYTASRIRGSRFIGYLRGGHVWIGHHGAILEELAAFLPGANTVVASK